MSLKEEVQELFDRKHELTRESLRRLDKGLETDEVKAESTSINARLQSILDNGLKGNFVIKGATIEKNDALVNITNGVFEIRCPVRYKQAGLKSFVRKPGAKQMLQRIAELKACLTTQQLLSSNKYVVGTSYFESREGRYVVMCREIVIAA